jgi:hypothetical protein
MTTHKLKHLLLVATTTFFLSGCAEMMVIQAAGVLAGHAVQEGKTQAKNNENLRRELESLDVSLGTPLEMKPTTEECRSTINCYQHRLYPTGHLLIVRMDGGDADGAMLYSPAGEIDRAYGHVTEGWDYEYNQRVRNWKIASRWPKLFVEKAPIQENKPQRTEVAIISTSDAPAVSPPPVSNESVKQRLEIAKLKEELSDLKKQTPPSETPALQVTRDERRVALVIGNARYPSQPLRNPTNDARDVAARLSKLNFKVFLETDLSLNRMRQAVRKFADEYARSDVGLVYYSGHGIETRGSNYLIPVNADIRREYELTEQAYPASQLTEMFETVQNIGDKERMAILILDACRNNDLPRAWRSVGKGLARMDAPKGTFISFATAPGSVAADGMGRNSPFTKHLLLTLNRPNLSIEKVFKEVRIGVVNETNNEQVPWESSSLMGDFYFNRTK